MGRPCFTAVVSNSDCKLGLPGCEEVLFPFPFVFVLKKKKTTNGCWDPTRSIITEPLEVGPGCCVSKILLLLLFGCSVVSTLCEPLDCSPPGSPVHGISQARMLEWVAIPFLQGIFPSQRLNLHLLSPALASGFFTTEPPGEPKSP